MIINAVMSNQFKLKFIPGFRTFLFPEKKDIHYIGGSEVLPAPLAVEEEAEAIRIIFDKYVHTDMGANGLARYLANHGIGKIQRQNGKNPLFDAALIRRILKNPVYCGKIAYGRRRTEKKQGTRNEMHVVEQSEFPIYEGQHEAIISEEDWYLAQEKRKINSFKREKVNNPDHAHILSGILKCPCCGKSMYGNIARAHSKDKKTRYYYYCKNTVTPTGHECSFRLNIEQTEINKFVAKIISAMVNNPRFVEAIQAKIGSAVDTEDMEKQIAVLQGQLKQAFGTKSRLERQMDTLDINDAHYDRKILDLQRRYDEQYDTIEEIEVQIGELQSQIRSIQQEKISGDNIYRLLLAFDEVYHSATEAEQKEFMKAFIERIEMFPEKRKDGSWIKKIVFNFPVPVDGEEVKELPLETETTVETVILLSRKTLDAVININLDMSELDLTSAESKATYAEIKKYVLDKFGLKVSQLYIAQVKREFGLIERINYNVGEGKNHVPQVTPEKREAIIDALKHFQMIE